MTWGGACERQKSKAALAAARAASQHGECGKGSEGRVSREGGALAEPQDVNVGKAGSEANADGAVGIAWPGKDGGGIGGGGGNACAYDEVVDGAGGLGAGADAGADMACVGQ